MRISDWRSDVCSSDLCEFAGVAIAPAPQVAVQHETTADAGTEVKIRKARRPATNAQHAFGKRCGVTVVLRKYGAGEPCPKDVLHVNSGQLFKIARRVERSRIEDRKKVV